MVIVIEMWSNWPNYFQLQMYIQLHSLNTRLRTLVGKQIFKGSKSSMSKLHKKLNMF